MQSRPSSSEARTTHLLLRARKHDSAGRPVTGAPRALCLLAAALLAGCSVGGGEDEQAAPTTTTASAARTPTSECTKQPTNGSGAAISAPHSLAVTPWRLDRTNLYEALGCVTLEGEPVSGARVRVNRYIVPSATDANGGFYYPIDATLPQRATVTVADASAARVGDQDVSAAQRAELEHAEGSLTVRFRLRDVQTERLPNGTIRVSGTATYDTGAPPPPVVLFAYQLSGLVRDANGRPVADAIVATRTLDLEIWTFSPPSAPDGTYRSYFYPSGDTAGTKVGLTVRVAEGDDTWELGPNEVVFFPKLRSAIMDVDLAPRGFPLPAPTPPRGVPGAVYEGLLVGVELDGKPVKPLAARWVDLRGHFDFVLPARLAGKTVSLWESQLYAFSRIAATPGGPIDVVYWPAEFPPRAPRGLGTITLPK